MRESRMKLPHRRASHFLLVVILLCISATHIGPQLQAANSESSGFLETPQEVGRDFAFRPVRTDSPRQTLRTFLRLRDDFELTLLEYRNDKTLKLAERTELIADQLSALIDLSMVPKSSRREVGIDTVAYLLDIFGRILPDLDSVPDEVAAADESKPTQWRIPHTSIRIVGITEGLREGEYLFSKRTVVAAPRFYDGIKNRPLESRLEIKSWSHALPQITGPMIPSGILAAIPTSLKLLWLDTPRWKVLAVFVVTALTILLLILLHRAIYPGEASNRLRLQLRRTIVPIVILIVVRILKTFFEYQINISGAFSTIVEQVVTVVTYSAVVWLFWLVVLAIFESIILSRNLPEEGVNRHLWRIGANTIGVLGSLIIIGTGAQELGLPLYSVVTGLGIGGLAIALAICWAFGATA